MRKICIIVTGIFLTFLFTACKQFNANMEEYLSYWSAEVSPASHTIDKTQQTNGKGILCIPSADDAAVTINLRNPQNFRLVMPNPPSIDAGKVIRFPGFKPDEQPGYGTDYTLTQTANDRLTLTYTQAFLQRYEWGTRDIGPEITFIAADGRIFRRKFSLNLKVDTAPALEYAGIGKTAAGTDDYYVLLFRVKGMNTPITDSSVHKDLSGGKLIITKSGGSPVEIPFSFNAGKTDFEAGADLLASGVVQKLKPSDSELPLPTPQDWILRVKTDVKVGGPKKTYSVSVKDRQGLSSAFIEASTETIKLPDVKLLDGVTPITGTTESAPFSFPGISGKTLTAKAQNGAFITGKIEKKTGSDWNPVGSAINGTASVSISLPALDSGQDEALYKITVKAALSGYVDSEEKEFFVKLLRQELPVLKLMQNFSLTDTTLHSISAGAQGYGSGDEDIIPDAGQYTAADPLVIYNASGTSTAKLEVSASAGTTIGYKLNSVGPVQLSTTPATISLSGTGVQTLEIWAVTAGVAGPHTTVHFKVITAVSGYSELKNIVQNAPDYGTGASKYDYLSGIIINIDGNLIAPSSIADTEMAVTGSKKLILQSSASATVRTINAAGRGRIFKISGSGTELTLKDIKLEGGYAADSKGGAVCVEDNGSLELSGGTVITPSTAADKNMKGKNDVYLANGANIGVNSGLTSTDPIVARITPADYNEGITVLTGTTIGSDYTKFSVTQPAGSTDNIWIIKNDGKLTAISTTITGGSEAWKKLRELVRIVPAGAVITINGEIKATNATDNSGEIVIDKDLTIKGSNRTTDILNANSNHTGTSPADAPTTKHRIFNVETGQTLTLEQLTLKGGKGAVAGNGGGAIYAEGTLIMTDCTVTGNETAYGNGGGIFAGDALTMTRCIVDNNTVSDNSGVGGGGLYIHVTGTHTMTNCQIGNNTAKYGEGGGIYAKGTLTMTGGSVTGNKTEQSHGGGIFVEGTLTMTGGSVTGNQAQANAKGGGIYAAGTLIMTGVAVTTNETVNGEGGGIYTTGTLTMADCTLTGNKAVNNKIGGGVYVDNGTFTMKGASCVTPSASSEANKPGNNDVYLADGKMITVDGVLSPAGGIAARITVPNAKYNTSTQVLTGNVTAGTAQNYTKFTVTPQDVGGGNMQQWEIKNNGFLQKAPVTITGGSGAWKKLKAAVQTLPEGNTITINGTITATNDSGNDNRGVIDITKNITIQGQTGANSDMLNANRDNLGTNAHPIFRVSGGKTLTLKNLTLTGGKGISGTFGGAINVTGGSSTAELEGCTIEDCQAEKGGAIGSGNGTTVKLKNTRIKKCKTSGSGSASGGGAIFASGATVEMTGCTLTGNEAKSGGAIYAQKHTSSPHTPSTVKIEGGTIGGTGTNDANKATEVGTDGGGGIYIGEACKLTLKDSAQVIGNTAVYNGAGIYTKGELTMENCTVTDNKTTSANNNTGGGGVYVESGIVKIKDATQIYHNYTDASGGGIYVNDGTVTLKNATIGGEQLYNGTDPGKTKGNNAQYCGGIYVKNGTITMENCTLNSNTALYGGGIQADNGNHTVKDCTLTNNEAYFYGGGIYVKGGSLTLNNTTIGGEQFYDGTDSGKTKGNKAKSGGGVYIEGNGTLVTMNGGSIQYNKTIDGKGGGVYIKGEGISFTMNGGKITQCKADVTSPSSTEGRGGGIYIYGDNASSPINITIKGSAEISHNESTCQGTASGGGIFGGSNSIITVSENAKIENNKAKGFGGGVYLKATFKFTGGTITRNTASLGTGIFSEKTSTKLEMSGNARVTNDNDIYLSSSVITITGGGLTGTAPVARITVADDKYQPTTQVLTAGTGVTLANETYKFAVTPHPSPAQEWTVGGNGRLKEGRYMEVPYGQLEAYLANNASATEVNYIEVTGIPEAALKGSYASPPNPGALGQKIKNNSSKKVALKLPDGLSVTDMSYCFVQCTNLVSFENFPSGVTDMRACFYRCENLTTVPDIPASVTGMKECFRFCRSLTTALNIPAGVYDMTSCFQNCKKLQSIKMNCHYVSGNFNGAFIGCDALPNGGIKVLSGELTNYQNAAGSMGTTANKFSAIP